MFCFSRKITDPLEPPTASNCFYLNRAFFSSYDKESKELLSSEYLPMVSESNLGGRIWRNLMMEAISLVRMLETLWRA